MQGFTLMILSLGLLGCMAKDGNLQQPESQSAVVQIIDSVVPEMVQYEPEGEGELSLHRISSKVLGYDLQYWVYTPPAYETLKDLPVLYVTDGKWYIEGGEMVDSIEYLIHSRQIEPILTVFVDAFDPDRPKVNRRNQQFLCNPNYVEFYKQELVPLIDQTYRTSTKVEERAMLGLSFGGLNSMFFAVNAYDTFGKIGIQSPAPHPCPDIFSDFEQQDKLPLDIYLSTGTRNDKAVPTRRLKRILEKKGYEFKYREVPFGHDWNNWRPLHDDVLIYFFPNHRTPEK